MGKLKQTPVPESLESFSKRRSNMNEKPFITPFDGRYPDIHEEAFTDIAARIIGEVKIEAGVSVWPMAVIRADVAPVRIAARSAVLDLAMVESTNGLPCLVEGNCLISHGVMVHGAAIRSGSLIGIGAVVLDGAEIGPGSIIGANALVTPRFKVPENSLVLGSPGKVIRPTTAEERENTQKQLEELYQKSRIYMAG